MLKGRIFDTLLNKECPLAVVALLSRDSMLIQFTRSRRNGEFYFRGVRPGTYGILVTHPAYADHSGEVVIGSERLTDLGTLYLLPKADTLQAVTVRPRLELPRIRGDTLEFNTNNIKLHLYATVEELLTRLPGVQIDANGVITVNGKKIERLLVDGEDFFGGDPRIVTRNFNADMIGKVQVLDKKSERAQFTGIDDGKTTKTLNLTLKEDSKKGYFSKVEAGGDPQGYYNINGLLGSFKEQKQFAALGMAANTGNTGFSGDIGGMGSGLSIGAGTNDALGASAGNGIPIVMGGGVHYADKWKEDHAVGNYYYGRLVTSPYTSNIVRQILPDSVFTMHRESRSHNVPEQHGFNIDYDYVPDSLSSFRFSIAGSDMWGRNSLQDTGSSSFNDTLVNSSLRTIRDEVRNRIFRGSGMWKIRGRKKKERVFSILAFMVGQDNTTKGYLYAENNFYKPGNSLLRSDTTDQRKSVTTNGLFLSSSLNYTEPLWKNALMGVSYEISYNRNQSALSTFGKNDVKYEDYIDSLGSHNRNDVINQRAILNLQVTNKIFSYTIGGDILHYAFRQDDILQGTTLRYNWLNFAPRANVRYNIDNHMGFRLEYKGTTRQPDISQLQPVRNNTDPLQISIGNPDLQPAFSQHFELEFHDYKPVTINAGINYEITNKGISTKTLTDSLGRQISQPVNTGGFGNGGLRFSIGKRLKLLNMEASFNTNANYGTSLNYVNQYLNKNENFTLGGGLVLNNFVPDKYSFQVIFHVNYFHSSSSINPSAATGYWTQSHNAAFAFFPIRGFETGSNIFYNWRQKIDHFDQLNSTIVWNSYINWNLLKDRLSLRWQINDILGKNTGISRSISVNQTTENVFNTIGRFWMISAAYHFVHRRKNL